MGQAQKVAIVTGASQGIGAGIVKGYRDAGYAVVANSRSIRKSEDAGVIAVPGDIGERAIAEAVVRTAVEHFGRIDTLVNNAGVYIGKPFTEFTAEDYQKIIHVNLDGFFHLTQLVIPHMLAQKSGHIVQITTSMVNQPIAVAGAGLAVLTKGGLDAVTRALAIEYAKDGIRVNAVARDHQDADACAGHARFSFRPASGWPDGRGAGNRRCHSLSGESHVRDGRDPSCRRRPACRPLVDACGS